MGGTARPSGTTVTMGSFAGFVPEVDLFFKGTDLFFTSFFEGVVLGCFADCTSESDVCAIEKSVSVSVSVGMG